MNFPTSNFVNYAVKDFRLAAPTSAGTALAAPFDADPLGNTRGATGVWDRGAFEFVSGVALNAAPAAPRGFRIQ